MVFKLEILMYLRSQRRLRNEVSLYEPIGMDKEGNEIVLMDILSVDQDISEAAEFSYEQERMKKFLHRLSKREKQVLEERYGLLDGFTLTQREIAKKLGISRSYVSRIEKKAIEKLLREMFSDER
ncbi:MAG: sigma-70 family RNA polymerase sigma factor [Clostridia bacterium]|nr:sigma-70 family RNA polymerase sigma factor [Clostridia bacterium]